jgi:hypothetical protein
MELAFCSLHDLALDGQALEISLMGMDDYTPYQQRLIKRYYENQDTIQLQRLAELVSELFLAEGKKRGQVWKRIESALVQLKVPAQRIEHLKAKDDPKLLAKLVQELQGR